MKKTFRFRPFLKKLFSRPVAKEERGGGTITLLVVCLFLALNLILVAVGGAWGFYFQITDKQYYTLNGSTDAYFAAVNPNGYDVRVYFCAGEDYLNENHTYGRIYDTVKQFGERYSYVTVQNKDVYFDYDELSVFAEKNETDLTRDSVIVFCPQTGESIVRSLSTFYVYDTEDSTSNSMVFNGEEILATMVDRVVRKERPKVYFTTGHGELSSVAMQSLLYSAGYDILTADLSRNEIEEDCSLIIISAPSYDFKEYADKTVKSEISRLRDFVARGGTVLVLRSPLAESLPRLDAFCASYGLVAQSGGIVRDGDMSLGNNSATLLLRYADGSFASSISNRAKTASSAAIVCGNSSVLTVTAGEGYRAESLLTTHESASLYQNGEKVSDAPAGGYTVIGASEVDTVSGGKGRVVLSMTAALGDTALLDMGAYGNESFFYSLFETAGAAATPIGCGVVVLNTYPLSDLNRSVSDVYFWSLTAGIPLLCAATGFLLLHRRKNR